MEALDSSGTPYGAIFGINHPLGLHKNLIYFSGEGLLSIKLICNIVKTSVKDEWSAFTLHACFDDIPD